MKEKGDIRSAHELAIRIIDNLERVIFGKRSVLELIVAGMLSDGHVLVEDVPGVGKTMLARSLAISTGCRFSRIQFTPDLLPSDITGVSVFNQQNSIFEFRPGPVFTQILMADEINRATPKAQSALLEAMGENQVSVDNVTRELPRPFFVIATQNPLEYEGVFPLPESQMDRFLLRTSIGYPAKDIEDHILDEMQVAHPIRSLSAVASADEIIEAQETVRRVFVSQSVRSYLLEIIQMTRKHEDLLLGASPRASLGLVRVGQSFAVLQGRDFVVPDDIRHIAGSVLSHRLILTPEARMNNVTREAIMSEILEAIRAPLKNEVKPH